MVVVLARTRANWIVIGRPRTTQMLSLPRESKRLRAPQFLGDVDRSEKGKSSKRGITFQCITMPRERKGSSSEDSGGSSSGETSGSESSGTEHSQQQARKTAKKDSASSKTKGGDSTPGKRDQADDDGKERGRKGKSGDVSSSDGEQMMRSGPRSTVVQKVSSSSQDKSRPGEEEDQGSPDRDSSKEQHEDKVGSQSKKRSRSPSPRRKESSKRSKDDRSSGRRGNDRRDDRRRHDRDSDKGRNRRDNDRRRTDDRRDDDRRGDRYRRDGGRGRDDKRREREDDRRDSRRSEREGGDRGRDREELDKDRNHGQDNKKDDNVSEAQKRKGGETEGGKEPGNSAPPAKKAKEGDDITTRTGGAYIPPAKLRMMQAQITDKSSVAYQRMAWEALKKSINGLVNKVNVSNIVDIVREVFQENIVRGRGLLARSVTQAQAASPTFTHVYAALVAIINTKFPQIGELILQRLILQFKRGFRRNDKNLCLSSTRFIAHLVNQQVAHEVVSLEILTLLLENATEDSVEVAISFLKECGQKLTEVSPRGINAIFERLRSILHEAQLDKRIQYMVEVMFAIRKDNFKAHPAVITDLDLVEEDDQFTHLLQLDDVINGQDQLNVFKADDNYLENEDKYKELKKEILDEGSSDEEGSGEESGSGDSSSDDEDDNEEGKQEIIDQTETNMVALRRTIYLTIQSSLDFEECTHKLLKMQLKPGQEVELCYMILDCNAQLRTYEKFFGLLAQRFCQLDKKYVVPFETIFREQFETIHRLDTNKLRNVAKLFAHLLHTDAISWAVMSCMKLTEEDTTSASRIFIKILFLELSEYLGLPKLNARLRDPTLQEFFEGILPRNNPKDTRFAINFFTTIGLGGLTEDLREHLKGISKQLLQQKQQQDQQQAAQSSDSDSSNSDSSDSNSSDSSSGSSDSSNSDSDNSDSSSDSEADKKKKKTKSKTPKKKPRSKDKSTHSRGDKQLDRRNSQHKRNHVEARQDRHSKGDRFSKEDSNRLRIEDKLLKMSLTTVDTPIEPLLMDNGTSPPGRRGGKKRDKAKAKMAQKKRRNSGGGQGQRSNERKRRTSNNFDQAADRDMYGRDRGDAIRSRGDQDDMVQFRRDRDMVRSRTDRDDMLHSRREQDNSVRSRNERDDIVRSRDEMVRRDDMMRGREDAVRGRNHTDRNDGREEGSRGHAMSPVARGRQGREDYTYSMDSRAGRRPVSPAGGMAQWEGASRDGYSQRHGERVDMDMSPPPRTMERHSRASPPLRRDRQEFDDPPPRRHDRVDVNDRPRQGYNQREMEDSPNQYNQRYDSPPPRRRDFASPPSGGRRNQDSPPRHMDSPPRQRTRVDVDRKLVMSKPDVERGGIERRRGDMDRGRDVDRGRNNSDRGRDTVNRNRDGERGQTMRDIDHSVERVRRDMDQGRGSGRDQVRNQDWDRDQDRARNRPDRGDGDRVVDRGRGNQSRSVERGRGEAGRGEVERGRWEVDRDVDRRDNRSLERGRGDWDRSSKDKAPAARDSDYHRGRDMDRRGDHSPSPTVRKEKVREKNEPIPARRSQSHEDLGKSRRGEDGGRSRNKDKRRR